MNQKDFQKAFDVLKLMRQQLHRSDIPYVNLVEGDLWMEMHTPDSAMKHYRIATETGNEYIAMQAFERMGDLVEVEYDWEKAFDKYQKSSRLRATLYRELTMMEERVDFEALKLKNQLNEWKVERQEYAILIMGLCLFVVILAVMSLFYFYRKRVSERKRLIQENKFLKQQEELSSLREQEAMLREKDARMREELFKRMNVFEKLSSSGKEQPIHFSDTDWAEIRLMLDSGYVDFTQKLRKAFPNLTDREINFCCLVRIHVSLQSLADIYCISKNSVSRRKLRLKEKLGVAEEMTLDDFLETIK